MEDIAGFDSGVASSQISPKNNVLIKFCREKKMEKYLLEEVNSLAERIVLWKLESF